MLRGRGWVFVYQRFSVQTDEVKGKKKKGAQHQEGEEFYLVIHFYGQSDKCCNGKCNL